MRATRTLLAALVLSLACAPAFAQQADEEGCTDHPMFSRMPNFFITSCEDQEFGVHEFDIPDGSRRVEGHYWSVNFEVREGAKAPGPLQVGRNYWNPMAAKGGKRYLEDLDAGGGTMVASMPGPAGSGTVWVQVSVSNSGEMYSVTIVQEAGMRHDVELDARALADALAKTGSVTLDNILFDTGRATITAASETPLNAVVDLLKTDAALTLEIQGHTDNVGAKDANQKLSKDRADSVRAWLVKAGIDAGRLTTAGFGDAQPVADNATDAGRAQNRRVVLVKKS